MPMQIILKSHLLRTVLVAVVLQLLLLSGYPLIIAFSSFEICGILSSCLIASLYLLYFHICDSLQSVLCLLCILVFSDKSCNLLCVPDIHVACCVCVFPNISVLFLQDI